MACQWILAVFQGCSGKVVNFLEGMTMLRWTGTTLAAGLMLAVGSTVWADDDTVRLGGPEAQNGIQGGTDTELVRGYYGGGYRGGFYGGGRGYYGGGYRGGFYGGGRGYYGGGFYGGSGYYVGGFYGGRGYYGGGFYGGRGYYGGFYGYSSFPSYYYSPYVYASYYNYPCAGDVAPAMTMQTQTLQYGPASSLPAPQPFMPPAGSTPGNFRYDGGPKEPVPSPIPGADMNPAKAPRAIVPLDGKLVGLPTTITGGFTPVTLTPLPKTTAANYVPRVAYPAYGER